MDLKIIKISVCPQCHEKAVCGKCRKHPDRKPVIVERFAMPAILKYAECGTADDPCCVKIACQIGENIRPESCLRVFWRKISHIKEPRAFGDLFCSRVCSGLVTGERRKTRVKVMCEIGRAHV